MIENSLEEIYHWAREHLGQRIMLDYVLYKINGQTPGSVFILLKQLDSRKPNAEIQVEFILGRVGLYQVSFSFLHGISNMQAPDLIYANFNSAVELIEWLQTGHKWK